MGLGFAFWLLAAGLLPQAVVGSAGAVVSAMMLCVTLAMLGLGPALITSFPSYRGPAGRLLGTAATLVAAAALAAALVFVVVASALLGVLDVVAASPAYALLFVAAVVLNALSVLLDDASTALRRADQALVRGVLFGACALAVGVVAAHAPWGGGSAALFAAWVVAGAATCLLGVAQLRRALHDLRLRPQADGPTARALLGLGMRNHVLHLSERAPVLVLPVLVAELLSPEANAVWYLSWMLATVVFVVPIQVGMTMLAEVAHDPSALARVVRRGMATALVLGAAAALVLVVAAPVVLRLLGEDYAEAGTTPVRVLVLALVPLTVIQAYFAACRATGRLGEATAIGWAGGAAAVAGCAAGALTQGLVGIAVAWVAVHVLVAVLAGLRLRTLLADTARPAGRDRGEQAVRPPATAVPVA